MSAGTPGRSIPTSAQTNRLNGVGSSYDAAGNLKTWNGAVYEYDRFNQMSRMTSGGEDWIYLYTADDERIWSYKADGTFSRWTLRDLEGKVLREYQNKSGVWSLGTDYIYRDGSLLAAETPTGRRHFHLDHLGTTRLITRGSGHQAAYHVYYPFGEELTAFNQDAEKMKFTGHERDLNSPAGAGDDLDYMHARHCSPVTGRFLGVDPYFDLEEATMRPQMWNRYAYVQGNPLAKTDPNGRFERNMYDSYYRPVQRETREREQRQQKALKAIRSLQQTTAWKNATPTQRFELLIQTAAKNTKGNNEAIAAAFSAVSRSGPFGFSVRNDLAGIVIPAGKNHGSATGADKTEHLLKNAELAMSLENSAAGRNLLIAFGDLLETMQPRLPGGGQSDKGDMEANRAGVGFGLAIEQGKVDLTKFTIGDIP
ncbi:MAG TPA: RHS repeat-associated core domain-containing protein [Thermoanaerobaculia bacterium]